MHEASLYPVNCFVTLTYDDEHLPSNMSLDYRDFQLFMKRLRAAFSLPVRFYMCGEYGSRTFRPHYHACLFNIHFPDQRHFQKTPLGHYIYSSPMLDRLWPLGQSTIGELNTQTAAYTARYIMAKITGDLAEAHYGARVPEFNRMSLKPGIGARWYDKFKSDIYNRDYLVVGGQRQAAPAYYDKLRKREAPEQQEATQEARAVRAAPFVNDQTPERLSARGLVDRARLSNLTRNLS